MTALAIGRARPYAGAVLRYLLQVAVAVIVLAWLAEHAPVLAVVVSLGLVGLLLWDVVGAVRGPARGRRLAMIAGFVVLGLVASSLILLALDPSSDAFADELAAGATCAGCTAGEDIQSIAVGHDGDRTELRIELRATPERGDSYWIIFESAPADPTVIERSDDGWRASVPRRAPFDLNELAIGSDDRRLTVSFPSAEGAGPLAVVSSGGDRVPSTGYATTANGKTVGDDEHPTRLSQRVAEAQALLPGLTPQQRDLARAILGRYVVDGTYVYDLELAGRPQDLMAVAMVRYPELAVLIYVDTAPKPTLLLSTHILEDGEHVCRREGDAVRCAAADGPTDIQLLDIEGMASDPDAVMVEPSQARDINGVVAACVRILATVENGPALGESCATADGVPAYTFVERTGQRLTLRERTPGVDRAEMQPGEAP